MNEVTSLEKKKTAPYQTNHATVVPIVQGLDKGFFVVEKIFL